MLAPRCRPRVPRLGERLGSLGEHRPGATVVALRPAQVSACLPDRTGPQTGLPHAGDAFGLGEERPDRKSTRLNSSHVSISYAVFCLKKKKEPRKTEHTESLAPDADT